MDETYKLKISYMREMGTSDGKLKQEETSYEFVCRRLRRTDVGDTNIALRMLPYVDQKQDDIVGYKNLATDFFGHVIIEASADDKVHKAALLKDGFACLRSLNDPLVAEDIGVFFGTGA